MPEQSIIDLILHSSEERNLEYKRSMCWDNNDTKMKVTKTSMAMANIPDGGVMVFGVDEISSGHFEPVGMNPDDANSFNQDDVSDFINGYADPFVELKVEKIEYDGRQFVIIQIQEFAELPIICKKDGQENLRRGGVYTRPRRKFESVLVPSQTEIREILEMAIDKRIRKYREDLFRWGIIRATSPEELDAEKFEEQLGEL